MASKRGNYYFQGHSWRAKMLKYLHCRQTLILICTLVVLECMCVMAELMVDLQGIRVRFDNEEEEVNNFLEFVKSENVSGMANLKGKSLTDVLKLVQNHLIYIDEQNKKYHGCTCGGDLTKRDDPSSSPEEVASRRKRSDRAENSVNSAIIADIKQTRPNRQKVEIRPSDRHMGLLNVMRTSHKDIMEYKYKTQDRHTQGLSSPNINRLSQKLPLKLLHPASNKYIINLGMKNQNNNVPLLINRLGHSKNVQHWSVRSSDSHAANQLPATTHNKTSIHERIKRDVSDVTSCETTADSSVFIFAVNIRDSGLYIVSHLANLSGTAVDEEAWLEQSSHYQEQTEAIQTISHTIKYVGFCILTIMLCETLIKIACLGTTFLKKKIEVFDAFIVVASFALDVVFIDSKWYESGKDATTILVLLLPWRVVRIVNSFMMTLNHKHKIEMMTVRRAKKRSDNKLRKLEHLSVEIRRDVELLINLCKLKGANEAEIDACIYSKGRGPTTLSAITSFASLMFISTLGKDPSQKDDFKDIYGDLVREVLEDEDGDEDSDTEKADSDLTNDKEAGDAEPKNIYYVSRSYSARANSAAKKSSSEHSSGGGRSKPRRATLPRRHGSCDDGDKNVYYINDGYENTADETAGKMRLYTKRESKSLPAISHGHGHNQAKNRSNVVTFEVTTQVTYL